MSDYMKQLKDEFKYHIRAERVYPLSDEADTVGFRLSKEQTVRLATDLLIAAQQSEQVFVQGFRLVTG